MTSKRRLQMLVLVISFALFGCGGESGDDPNSPTLTATPTPSASHSPLPSASPYPTASPAITPVPHPVISDLNIHNITATSAAISFQTDIATSVMVDIYLAGDSFDAAPHFSTETASAITHEVNVTGLWSDNDWRIEFVMAGEVVSEVFSTTAPDWPSVCREGDLALPAIANAQWSIYSDDNGTVNVSATDGCENNSIAARMDFDLGDGEWVVVSSINRFSPVLDLSGVSHLWIPFKGSEGLAVAFEVKLKDANGALSVVRLEGGTGLPVWRSWAVDLRQFTPQVGSLDLSSIVGLEFAFSSPYGTPGPRSGTVSVGEISAWNIESKKVALSDFEHLPPNEAALQTMADDLLARQHAHGFIPAWYDLTPNWHLYANAMALIVFTLEYERLEALESPKANDFLNAATLMADQLVRLQALSHRNGGWDDSFRVVNNELTLHPEWGRVFWVGSTAWAGIALIFAYDILPQGETYADAIRAAVAYYTDEQACRSNAGLPIGSVTEGTEGNISSHLFIEAATARSLGDPDTDMALENFIADELFDTSQRRFLCGVRVDFGSGYNAGNCSLGGSGNITGVDAQACLDVVANWGSAWLLRQGRTEDALEGLAFGRYVFPTQGFTDTEIKGMGDIAGPWSPAVEFGAGQWASLGGPDSNYIMNQAWEHLCPNGACRGASDDFAAGIGWNTTARGISPTAWMYIAWHGGFWERL